MIYYGSINFWFFIASKSYSMWISPMASIRADTQSCVSKFLLEGGTLFSERWSKISERVNMSQHYPKSGVIFLSVTEIETKTKTDIGTRVDTVTQWILVSFWVWYLKLDIQLNNPDLHNYALNRHFIHVNKVNKNFRV